MGLGELSQLFIALFGVTAIALTQSESTERRKWASVFGLIGQPFWFYSAISTEQWGVVALCFLYSWAWGKGFYTAWIKPRRKK